MATVWYVLGLLAALSIILFIAFIVVCLWFGDHRDV